MTAAVRGCPRARGPRASSRGADARRTTGVPVSRARDGGGHRRPGLGRSCRRADAERGAGAGVAARGGRFGPRAARRSIGLATRRRAHRRTGEGGRDGTPVRPVACGAIAEHLAAAGRTDRRGSGGLGDLGASAGERSGAGGADHRRSGRPRSIRIGRGVAARPGDRAGVVAATGGARDLLRGAASRRWSLFIARAVALALTQL